MSRHQCRTRDHLRVKTSTPADEAQKVPAVPVGQSIIGAAHNSTAHVADLYSLSCQQNSHKTLVCSKSAHAVHYMVFSGA
jgi:hypothetical protein